MHEIAECAGVGKATVSLALRDDPRLRLETRQRIQNIARKMGYRTNATVANLMAQLRASGNQKYHATLGLLNISPDPGSLERSQTGREWIAGCQERASELGYGLQNFWLFDPGTTAAQLSAKLEAQAIRGMVIAGADGSTGLQGDFETLWRQYAFVAVGHRPGQTGFDFSSNDQFSTALQAVQYLHAAGYHRMGLVLSPELDAMVDRRFSAGYWAGLEGLHEDLRIPIWPFLPSNAGAFRAWYEQHRPDVILTLHEEVRQWLLELHVNIPEETALAHLDWHEGMVEWSGMHQNNKLVGAAAIDMLVGELHRNEVGIPTSAKASFIQSRWVHGPSTRA